MLLTQGETHTYTWYLPKSSGPTEEQEECSVGAYYSTVDVIKVPFSPMKQGHGTLFWTSLDLPFCESPEYLSKKITQSQWCKHTLRKKGTKTVTAGLYLFKR